MEVKRLKYVSRNKVNHGYGKIAYYYHFTEEGRPENEVSLKHAKIFNDFGVLRKDVVYEIEYVGDRVYSIADWRQKTVASGNKFTTIDRSTGEKKVYSEREKQYWENFLKSPTIPRKKKE